MADSAAYQSSFHAAFRDDLFRILDALPAAADALDVPCGNGFYARKLAERVGRLTAVDADEHCLRQARAALAGAAHATVQKADAYRLPFADATFDLVWCAQSLITLDPARAVAEMARVLTADGVLGVLEVDDFHHVLLPWPVELEAALPLAVKAAAERRYGDAVKTSPARRLRGVLTAAGLRAVRRVTYPFDRAAPFDLPTTDFLRRHFDHLRAFVYPYLSAAAQAAFDRAADPDGDAGILRQPDAELVCLNAVYFAGSPANGGT